MLLVETSGETEVREFDMAFGVQENVVGFYVTNGTSANARKSTVEAPRYTESE